MSGLQTLFNDEDDDDDDGKMVSICQKTEA